MKVFLSFLQGRPDHPISAYSFWEFYIKNGISEAGWEWVECPNVDWALGLVDQDEKDFLLWKEKSWHETLQYLKKNPVDLFLGYLYPQYVDEQAIKEIQKLGIPCVNFFCDNVRQFTQPPKTYKIFDLNWVPEYQAVKFYKKANYSTIHLPMPMWVPPANRIIPFNDELDISFIGSKDLLRQMLFEEALEKDPSLPIYIYGNWEDTDGAGKIMPHAKKYTLYKKLRYQIEFLNDEGIIPYLRKLIRKRQNQPLSASLIKCLRGKLSFEEYLHVSQFSKITLGVNRYESFRFSLKKPDRYSRLRDIEAPMLGSCYLTEYNEDLDCYYEIGKDIEVYSTTEELIEKSKELMNNPQKRKSLRVNGQNTALNKLSIPISLNKIKTTLDI